MSFHTLLTKTGSNVLLEAFIPTRINGRMTGKLSTGAKNPAWLALVAMAPMRVKTKLIPVTTSNKLVRYGNPCCMGNPMKNPNNNKFARVKNTIDNMP